MRTTLTLDPDVEAALKEIQRRTGAARKTLINEAIRRGLRNMETEPAPKRAPYRTKPFDSGTPALEGIHSVHDLLAFAEGEDFR